MKLIGFMTMIWDADIQQWKPFARKDGIPFWYGQIAALQEIATLENLFKDNKFKLAYVRI